MGRSDSLAAATPDDRVPYQAILGAGWSAEIEIVLYATKMAIKLKVLILFFLVFSGGRISTITVK